jgi:two-component system nitrogen regulation response regulator NtrX
VVPIAIPPLQARREDIPDLAREFIRRAADALRQPARELADDACAALQAYDWPGNVRELRNVVERLLIMTPPGENPITAEMLPAEITGAQPSGAQWDGAAQVMSLPLRDARELFEREYLSVQISRFGGNISKTAEFVGMERSALHRKLKSLGLGGEGRARNA